MAQADYVCENERKAGESHHSITQYRKVYICEQSQCERASKCGAEPRRTEPTPRSWYPSSPFVPMLAVPLVRIINLSLSCPFSMRKSLGDTKVGTVSSPTATSAASSAPLKNWTFSKQGLKRCFTSPTRGVAPRGNTITDQDD